MPLAHKLQGKLQKRSDYNGQITFKCGHIIDIWGVRPELFEQAKQEAVRFNCTVCTFVNKH